MASLLSSAGLRAAETNVPPATSSTAAAASTSASSSTGTADSAIALPAVTVDAPLAASDPDAIHAQAQQVDLGPLRTMKAQDAPFTVTRVPHALIEEQQAHSMDDLLSYLPSVQPGNARPQARGFQGTVANNMRLDGFNVISTTDYPAEQFDHLDVLDGVAGAIYGPQSPSGIFAYASKRPTDTRLWRMTAGFASASRWLRALDAGGRVGPNDMFGYRINLLDEDGHGSYAGSRLKRTLASGAFDVHFSKHTVLETNFSYYRHHTMGDSPNISLASGVSFPSASALSKARLGQSWGGHYDTTETMSFLLKHDFNGNWHASGGMLHQIADRQSTAPTVTFTNNAGAYTTTASNTTATEFTVTSNQGYLTGKVDTGPFQHALTIGTNGFVQGNFNPRTGASHTIGTGNLDDPQAFAEPNFGSFTNRYKSADYFQQSLIVSDTISFARHWAVMLTGSESWMSAQNYNLAGRQTSAADNSGFSPSVSLLYKPVSNLTTYVTYANSLQQGDTAPTGTVNQSNILAPYRSKQWEIGAKLALRKLDLTLAAYQITRPFAYTDATTLVYETNGEQRNRGVDFMANGEILPNLSFFGGVSYLDPRVEDTASAATSGKRIVGLSNWTVTGLLRYRVPQVEGLSVYGKLRYASGVPTDNQNQTYAPGYTTLGFGGAYTRPVYSHPVTFRLAIENITNTSYFANIYPGGLSGYSGAGNATGTLGAPRTVFASMQVDF